MAHDEKLGAVRWKTSQNTQGVGSQLAPGRQRRLDGGKIKRIVNEIKKTWGEGASLRGKMCGVGGGLNGAAKQGGGAWVGAGGLQGVRGAGSGGPKVEKNKFRGGGA